MPNRTIRLESTFGNLVWVTNDKISKTLDTYPEETVKRYMKCYTDMINIMFHFLFGCMSSPLDFQTESLTRLDRAIKEISGDMLIKLKQGGYL